MTRTWISTLVVVAVLVVAACTGKERPGPPKTEKTGTEGPMSSGETVNTPPANHGKKERPLPEVRSALYDLTSAIGTTPIQVVVTSIAEVGDGSLDTLAKGVRLVTWPDLQDVAFDTKVHRAAPEERQPRRASIDLLPSKQLEDRWYAVVLPKSAPGFSLPTQTAALYLSDESRASRFRPGSDPVVALIRAFEKEPGLHVEVDFSERVELDGTGAAAAVRVSGVSGSGMLCEPRIQAGVSSFQTLTIVCSGASEMRFDVQVGGLRSTSGPALARRVYSLDRDKMFSCGPACRFERPSVP